MREKMKKNFRTNLTKLTIVLAMISTLTACGDDEVAATPDPVVTEDSIKENAEVEEIVETVDEVGNQEEASPEDFIFQDSEDGSGVILSAYEGTASKITVPDTYEGKPVIGIGGGCFYGNKVIEEVILPDSVTIIYNEAFCMSGLKNITLGNATEVIGNDAFTMTALEEIILPETVTILGESAFSTTDIKEITIPSQIEILPISVFALSKLEKIVIPGNVKVIDERAFDGCRQLREVEIQEGVESIEYDAFDISSLDVETELTVSIPASVTFIDWVQFKIEGTSVVVVGGSYAEELAIEREMDYSVK